MHLIFIRALLALSFITTLLPQTALAILPSNSFSCSSNLVVSIDNGYQATCDGDFSFTNGVLENDVSISIIALGMLNIGETASLIAPIINLNSPQLHLSAGSKLTVGNIVSSTTIQSYITHTVIQATNSAVVSWSKFNIADTNYLNSNYISGSGVGTQIYNQPIMGQVLTSQAGTLVLANLNGIINTTSAPVMSDTFIITTSVPEPSSYLMMLLGLMIIGCVCRFRKIRY